MSVYAGPEISTDGLVFAFDADNTEKSWKGMPATNLIISTPLSLGVYAYASGPVSTTNVLDAANTPRTVNRYTITSAVNTARARVLPSGLTTNVSYTFSCKIKYNGTNTTSPSFEVAASKGNPEGGANNNTISSSSLTSTSLGNGWYYIKYTWVYSACPTGGCILTYGVVTGSDSAYVNNTFDVYEDQFEVNSFASPYITQSNGIRSNTESILDLIKTNIITASSLTYNSNNTFSFDGSTNYCLLNYSGFFDGAINYFRASAGYAWSVSAWFKFPVSPVNSKTGNASYAICGQSGGIGGGETFTLFVGSGTDSTYGSYAPYYCAVGIYGSKTIISPSSVNTNTWNNVVVTWDGSAGRVYFNGVDRGALNIGTAALQTGYNFSIGMTGTSGALNAVQCFEGSIGNISVYNVGLSATKVAQNFNALRGRFGI